MQYVYNNNNISSSNLQSLYYVQMVYHADVFKSWSQFDHPNVIPLLAVVNVIPGSYVVMPRMTGKRLHRLKL